MNWEKLSSQYFIILLFVLEEEKKLKRFCILKKSRCFSFFSCYKTIGSWHRSFHALNRVVVTSVLERGTAKGSLPVAGKTRGQFSRWCSYLWSSVEARPLHDAREPWYRSYHLLEEIQTAAAIRHPMVFFTIIFVLTGLNRAITVRLIHSALLQFHLWCELGCHFSSLSFLHCWVVVSFIVPSCCGSAHNITGCVDVFS